MCNCRTSNAWELDLALSVTHFPERRLTIAILYGTTINLERDIVRRLDRSGNEVTHPLLLPGIFIELERARHADVVKKTIVMLEEKTMQFQVNINELKGRINNEEKEKRNESKRDAWLDTIYLKNGLLTWKTQIKNMAKRVQELNSRLSLTDFCHKSGRLDSGSTFCDERDPANAWSESKTRQYDRLVTAGGTAKASSNAKPVMATELSSEPEIIESPSHPNSAAWNSGIVSFDTIDLTKCGHEQAMGVVGKRIEGRLLSIQDEYEDWVRDCSTRAEGMAMATQWVHIPNPTQILA